MERSKVWIPANVLKGLEAVRRSGKTNMLDIPVVIDVLIKMAYIDAAFWVYDNRHFYSRCVIRGFEPEEEGRDQCAD